MPAVIQLNGQDYILVPRDVRVGGSTVKRDLEEYMVEQFGIVRRQSGVESPEQIQTYRSIIFPNLMLGLGRDRIDSDSHANPDEYRRFWFSNGVDTRWGRSSYLPILEEDSTETGLEVIRASASFRSNLHGLWEDASGRIAVNYTYTGSTTTWTSAGTPARSPTYDASSNGSTSGTSLTVSHTVANQPNRGLIVSVSTGGAYPSGITYAGTAMARISEAANTGNYVSIWSLANPSAGTNNIIVSLASSDHIIAGGNSFFHVDQSSVLSNAGTNNNSSATSSSITVTTTANDFAVDAISVNNGSPTLIVGSGQAQRHNVSSVSDTGGSSTEIATGSSTAMSWSWTTTVAVAHVAARVNGLPFVPLDIMAHKTHLIALLAHSDSHAIHRSSNGTTWTVATTQLTQDLLANDVTQSEDIDAGLLAQIGNEAVAILWDEDSGTITFFSSTDAGAVWTDEAVDISSGNGPQGVAVYPDIDNIDKLYVMTREGLWMVDTSSATWTTRYVLPLPAHNDHGRRMIVHNGMLWFGIGVDDNSPAPIWTMNVQGDSREYDTRKGLNVGDGVEAEALGPVRRMKSDGLLLYASVGGGAASRNAQVICHNGDGWHTVRRHGTADQEIQWIDLSPNDNGTLRLHYAIRTGTSTSDTRFLAYPSTNPNSGVSIKRELSGYIDLPYLDLGMPFDSKAWVRVGVNAEDLSADNTGEYINVDYGILSSGALQARNNTDLGDFLSGTTTIDFASGAGVASRQLGIRVNLHRNSSPNTDTPKLYDIEIAGRRKNNMRGFRMTLDLAASSSGATTVEVVRTNLETARDLDTNPVFVWGPSGNIYVEVKALVFFDELRDQSGVGGVAPDSRSQRGGYAELVLEELI